MSLSKHVVYVSAVVVLILAPPMQAGAQPVADEILQLPPADGGVRRWSVTNDDTPMFASPSADASLIGNFPQHTVLSNLGCSKDIDTLWCKVRPFRGGAAGFVPAQYLLAATGPDGTVPMGLDDSKARARKRDFDAKGSVFCAQNKGDALATCPASVARSTGGDATVVVTFANGFARQLYFANGEFIRASATMSGVGKDTDWAFQNGMHILRVDDQRYDVPNVLVFGQE